jgi:flagellar basal-body rod modification protein FlgD
MDAVTSPVLFSGTNTTKPTAPPEAATEPKKKALTSDFETFLRMLTVQMQNQDPLNPVDSSDYAVQLATFSGVEQAVRTNQLLEGMGGQFNLLGMAQFSGWIGQEARSDAAVSYDGQPTTVSYTADSKADRAVLVVKDASGATLAREEVPHRAKEYSWLGGDAVGNPLANGTYRLSLESYQGSALIGTTAVEGYARVTEVRNGATGPVLVLQGGQTVEASKVSALRQASLP